MSKSDFYIDHYLDHYEVYNIYKTRDLTIVVITFIVCTHRHKPNWSPNTQKPNRSH